MTGLFIHPHTHGHINTSAFCELQQSAFEERGVIYWSWQLESNLWPSGSPLTNIKHMHVFRHTHTRTHERADAHPKTNCLALSPSIIVFQHNPSSSLTYKQYTKGLTLPSYHISPFSFTHSWCGWRTQGLEREWDIDAAVLHAANTLVLQELQLNSAAVPYTPAWILPNNDNLLNGVRLLWH